MKYHSTSHFLHLILTVVTGGAWAIIWIWRGFANRQANLRQEFNRRNGQ